MSDADRRIGNQERDAAVAALQVHLTAGRLDSSEYEDRSVKARQARTRADLALLFADLPQPWPQWDDTTTTPVPSSPSPAPRSHPVPSSQNPASQTPSSQDPSSQVPASPETAVGRPSGLLPEPWGAWVMSLTPFAALILFFATGYHWQWFLLIPIAGLIVYGPDGRHGHRDRYRDRRRGR